MNQQRPTLGAGKLTCNTFSLENMFHFSPTRCMWNLRSASGDVKLTKAYPTCVMRQQCSRPEAASLWKQTYIASVLEVEAEVDKVETAGNDLTSVSYILSSFQHEELMNGRASSHRTRCQLAPGAIAYSIVSARRPGYHRHLTSSQARP